MSTFGGTVREYERISIDRFDGVNLNSTAFFLSHCHRDHMHGLGGTALKARLRARPDAKLYVSEVSRRLLLNEPKYGWLKRHIVALPLDCPNTVTVPSNFDGRSPDYEIVVTLVSAEHCAGSVMFLFEGEHGRVLYTGDFRLAVGDTEHLAAFHEPSGATKRIRCAYVDTTLCSPEAAYVPSREDSVAALITLARPALQAGGFLRLALPGAQLGYEGLFQALFSRFGMRVHVTKSQMSRYAGLTSVQETLTTDSDSTRIHANCYCELGSPCVTVKPSAMWFAHRVGPSGLVEKIGEDWYRLCYSTHASLAEVRDLVRHLQPDAVCANVCLPGLNVLDLVWPERRAVRGVTDQVEYWRTKPPMKCTVEEIAHQTVIQTDDVTEEMICQIPDKRTKWMGVHVMAQRMEQTMEQVIPRKAEQATDLTVDEAMKGIAKDETTNETAELIWDFWGSDSEGGDAEICLLDPASAGSPSKKKAVKEAPHSATLLRTGQMEKEVMDQVTKREVHQMKTKPIDQITHQETKLVWNFWGSDSSDGCDSDSDCFVVESAAGWEQ